MNHSTFIRDLGSSEIERNFILLRSLNVCGILEIQIKSIKKHVLKTIGETILNIEQCFTHLV